MSYASFDVPVGGREFTGQEQIPDVGLVNMNGRLYDPSLGRFLSPDPNIQFVANLQSYNRYSYAGNNPLRYTDPTGYFWSELGNFFSSTFSNPFMDFQLAMSLAACVGTGGAGCMLFGLALAAFNSFVAISNGAGFDQTILNAAIGLGVGLATGGLGQELGLNAWTSLIMGSASAAITTGISNVMSGKAFFQVNVLGSALLSAAEGAATLGLQKLVPVSQASTEAQGKGGSGESRVEVRAMHVVTAAASYEGGDAVDQFLAEEGIKPDDSSVDQFLNTTTRERIASEAVAIGADGPDYATAAEYHGRFAGEPKCNFYVRDVLNQAGASTPSFQANVWGNADSEIPGWSVVDSGSAEEGDVAAFERFGGHHGHMGIVELSGNGTPFALAASTNGVTVTSLGSNAANAGPTVVWRWTGN